MKKLIFLLFLFFSVTSFSQYYSTDYLGVHFQKNIFDNDYSFGLSTHNAKRMMVLDLKVSDIIYDSYYVDNIDTKYKDYKRYYGHHGISFSYLINTNPRKSYSYDIENFNIYTGVGLGGIMEYNYIEPNDNSGYKYISFDPHFGFSVNWVTCFQYKNLGIITSLDISRIHQPQDFRVGLNMTFPISKRKKSRRRY